MNEKKNKREKRVYDEAFRREAVALLQSSDEPLVQMAAKLGVSQWNLRDWRKQYGDSDGKSAAVGAIGTGAVTA
jgi:transposase-like protein